ncbi:MAG: glycoside hydrolase family 65 protein, partial [Thermodesulfobacteriota bacterium]
ISQKTKRSELHLACAMGNHLGGGKKAKVEREQTGEKAAIKFRIEGRQQKKITFQKYVAYHTSLDEPVEELPRLALETVSEAQEKGFAKLLEEQKNFFKNYWKNVGLHFSGDLRIEQGLHYNLFHLVQGFCTKRGTGIPAKGLTSEGYDGHYFWDTEIYMVPFFSALLPDLARKLLEFRYSILDHARSRARELAHNRGALYPWRTIAGEEGSAYYPASTAQYHINAAIAYAISKYIEVTGDYSYMLEYGAEIIFETARLWEDLGAYIPSKGNYFCYNEVTGPDEYTALVSNNCYTNLMARWHLRYAHDTALLLKKKYPDTYRSLAEKIDLKEMEIEDWKIAADAVYIPYDDNLQVHPQDDSFFDKEVWDFSTTPPGQYPLLLYYHPLVIYRYQVCKQPDVILAQLLLGDSFSLEQKQRNYQYYEPITTHDSSLSPSIFSIAASELGFHEDAYRFFTMTARLDLDNIFRDTHYGVHMASMAGSWLAVTQGFAGMRTNEDGLSFNPYLPHNLYSYRFRVVYRNCCLKVSVSKHRITYTLLDGESIEFKHSGSKVILAKGENVSYMLGKAK